MEIAPEKARAENLQTSKISLFEVSLDYDFQIWLMDLCKQYELQYEIMVAMAETESHFEPEAVGQAGELGMWQIKSSTAKEAEKELGRRLNLFKPEDNAEAAAVLMGKYLKKYGTVEAALMAYNMGESGARKSWEEGIKSSQYTDIVLKRAAGYKKIECIIAQVNKDAGN